MFIPESMIDWVLDLGIEIRLGKRREDLKLVGVHLYNPTMYEIMSACYDALASDVKLVVIYLQALP
jgi:hypothetical protein